MITTINGARYQIWSVVRLAALFVAFIAAATPVWAQQKYTITQAPASDRGQYVNEHAIEVGDVPEHRLRVYEIHHDYPQRDNAFAGVVVKEMVSRCTSDYINGSGANTCYNVFTLEDGNKVFSRLTGTAQSDSARGTKGMFVENYLGGTGKFKGIRGQVRGSTERAPGTTSLKVDVTGEYWIEE